MYSKEWMLTVRTHTSMVNLSMTKEIRIDKKEKTTSSIKGVGKTRELHAKNQTGEGSLKITK